MAVTSGPQIALSQIHVEAGGSATAQASLNDADIRALIGKGSGVQMAMSEWYGASRILVSGSAFFNSNSYAYAYACRHPSYGIGNADWYMYYGAGMDSRFDYSFVAQDYFGSSEFCGFVYKSTTGAPLNLGSSTINITNGVGNVTTSTYEDVLNNNDSRYVLVSEARPNGTFLQFLDSTCTITVE